MSLRKIRYKTINCLECNKKIYRKSGNQKFCVLCANEVMRKTSIKKNAEKRLKREKFHAGQL